MTLILLEELGQTKSCITFGGKVVLLEGTVERSLLRRDAS